MDVVASCSCGYCGLRRCGPVQHRLSSSAVSCRAPSQPGRTGQGFNGSGAELAGERDLEGTALGWRSRQLFAIVLVKDVVDAQACLEVLERTFVRLPGQERIVHLEGWRWLASERISAGALLRCDQSGRPAESEVLVWQAPTDRCGELVRGDCVER